MYSDGARELEAACRLLLIPHDAAESGEPQNISVAERQVQEVKQGTTINMVQAGLPQQFWSWAMQHFATASNMTTDKRGSSPWERRNHEVLDAQQIPFGARVRFLPLKTSRHWQNKLKFEEKAIEGVFLGWKINVGGKWSKLYIVAPLQDFDPYTLLKGDTDSRVLVLPQSVSRVWPVSNGAGWEFPLRE